MNARIPVITTLDELIPWLRMHIIVLTEDVWSTVSGRLRGVDRPALLYDLVYDTDVEVPNTVLGFAAADAWSGAEYPAQCVDPWHWEEWFEQAGYTVDGRSAPQPDRPVTLYRGSTDPGGMSWTSDRSVAERFATGRLRGRAAGQVFEKVFDPRELLAHLTEREESEYIVYSSY